MIENKRGENVARHLQVPGPRRTKHHRDERSTAPSGAPPKPRFPKNIRLSKEAYQSGSAFSVTIVTANRRPIFAEADLVDVALTCLRNCADKHRAEVFTYCFMPDHVHLLARTPAGVDFSEFIRIFKQTSSYRLRRMLTGSHVWQPSYFDHALRSSEDLADVATYILGNPVRADLVEHDYPHAGSLIWNVTSERGT